MAIQVICPRCNGIASLPDSAAGKKGRCAICKTVFPIPGVLPDDAATPRAFAPAAPGDSKLVPLNPALPQRRGPPGSKTTGPRRPILRRRTGRAHGVRSSGQASFLWLLAIGGLAAGSFGVLSLWSSQTNERNSVSGKNTGGVQASDADDKRNQEPELDPETAREDARRRKEREAAEAQYREHPYLQVTHYWLDEQRRGGNGYEFWDPEFRLLAEGLINPREWTLQRFAERDTDTGSGRMAGVQFVVHASNRGGVPIISTFTVVWIRRHSSTKWTIISLAKGDLAWSGF